MSRLGRPFFREYPEKLTPNFIPTPRQLEWMQFINLHGPQSSAYLHEYTIDRAKDYDRSKQAMYKLWLGGMVYRPKQQMLTYNANYHHYVYDLTKRGKKFLEDNGLLVEAHRPSGQWVHMFMVSTLTATMHIMCNRHGYRYIPGHEITDTLSTDVEFDWDGRRYTKTLHPDALFAIDYGGSFLSYIIEADRNTEANDPKTPHRKSARRNIKQYKNFYKQYRELYNLNCPLVILTITTSKGHIKHVLKLVEEEIGACSYLAFGLAPDFGALWKPPKLMDHLFTEGLVRNGKDDFVIKK